jgi:nitrate reductase NapA
MPKGYCEVNTEDAKRMDIRDGDPIRLTSRRGTIVIDAMVNGRGNPPKGMVFVPFFDEDLKINELTIDAYCPISKQPDYKKCAIKVEKA